MSEMYNRIEMLCKRNYMDVTSLCRELKISRSSLSELKSGRAKSISAQKVAKIADYFHVSASFITNGISSKFLEHFIPDETNEKVKAENKNIVSQYPKKSLDECVQAQIKVFECYFSRNFCAEGYNPNFISFERYVALRLGQKHTKDTLHADIYSALINIYGQENGMTDGKSYYDTTKQNEKTSAENDEGVKSIYKVVAMGGMDGQDIIIADKEHKDKLTELLKVARNLSPEKIDKLIKMAEII